MKTFYISCLILSIAMNLHAQQAVPQPSLPPLPPGPLIKRTPDYSAWTVTCKGHPVEEKAPVKPATTGEDNSKEKEPITMVSNVIKTGSTILEQNVEADGKRRQIWHVSGFRIISGIANPMISPDYGGGDILTINFATADFAGFYWLSPATYAGIVKYQGNDCIVFRGSVSPLSEHAQADERAFIQDSRGLGQSVPDALRVPATAYIDLATRLPVFAEFGQEKRTYLYGSPPPAPLQLPAELAGAVKQYEEQIRRLSAPAARGY